MVPSLIASPAGRFSSPSPDPRPSKLVAANGVAVREGAVLYPKKMCAHRFSPVVTVCIGPFSLPPAGQGREGERSRNLSELMQESHPLKVPTDDGLRSQAQ